ncbi:hypothetical protein QBC34DRAFT_363720 [Podospora aff. communis PSN243]|uniref:Uncharacterized protein n=1 Tax=Podospora aff. communis PSN243 TaxID=3040156 RepID=A0AAV9G4T5_9PEZI|nr:hypothetical protein QBC34DRAFT_363720 [Podospora aff. communis PSN243]
MGIPNPATTNDPPTPSTVFRRPDIISGAPDPAPLLYINGFPGVGKEALAECLSVLLGDDKSLLINLRCVNPNLSLPALTPEHPSYFSPSSLTSPASLSRILAHPDNASRLAIIALYLPDDALGQTTISTLRSAATSAGRLFVPICLTCEPAEHLKRASSLQRQLSSHKRTGRRKSSKGGIDKGEGTHVKGEKLKLARAKGMVTVDITRISLLEAAVQILEHVRGREREREMEMEEGKLREAGNEMQQQVGELRC